MDDWAGTDFSLEGDLGVTNQGDYSTVSSYQNVDAAVIRRMKTPLGALWYDPNYGNGVYDLLSKPMDAEFVVSAKQQLQTCLEGEERIHFISANVRIENEDRMARFAVTYKYADGLSTRKTLEGVITDDSISVSG